jgi:translocation and assembly module TamB
MIKRKHVIRILLTMGFLILVIVLSAIAVLRSRAFHRYVLAKMIEEASQATGSRVEIGDFQFHWSGPKVDLNHIVLHGTESASGPPLLQIDHLRVGLKILSLWRRKIDLNEIVIDHPSIHMFVAQNGKSNLTIAPQGSPGGGSGSIFDLGIGHFVVNQGEVNYNDRHIPLEAELHALYVQVSFASLKREYRGVLGYRDGRVQFGSFNPVQHSVDVHFGATPAGLTLDSLQLDAGSSKMSVQAHLQDYSNPAVDGSYQVNLSTGELGAILKAASFSAGQVNLQGTLHYVNRPGQPLLDSLALDGKINSPYMALNLPQGRASVQALSGEYRLSGGTLEVRNVQAGVLGGRMSGDFTLAHLSQQPEARVSAAVRDVSLEAASRAAGASQLERAAITGKLDGTVEGSWQGSGENLQLRSDATITAAAPVEPGGGPEANAIPLQGALHLAYDGQSGVLSLRQTQFTAPHSTLKLDGSTGQQSSLNIQAHSDDLGEVDQLALIARRAGGGARPSSPTPAAPFGISGSGSFDGQLRGSMTHLQLTGQLSGVNLEYQGTTLSELRANVALSPSSLFLSQGDIQTPERALIQFSVQAGLHNWTYTPQSQVRLDLTAARVPVATIQRIANLHYPVTGTLAARISLHGSQSNLEGQGSATLAQAVLWNQPVQNLSVQFQGGGSTISSTLQVQTPAGSGSGKLRYDFRSQAYDVQFSIPNLQLAKIEAASQRKLEVEGILKVSLQGRGTVKDPELAATIQAPKLVIDQQNLDGLKLQANVAQQKATLSLDTAAQGASIQARANVNLDANYNATGSLDVRNIQLGPLLASFKTQTPAELHGQAELHGSFHGPLKQWEQVEAEVDIPTLNLAYQSLQIGNASPIRALYRGGVVSLEQCALKGTGTDLQVQATVPLECGRSMQAKAVGNIDLHLLQLLYPDWISSGQVRLDAQAEGALAHPDVHGNVRLIDAALQPPQAPLGAQKLNVALAFQNGRVDIQNFTGECGGGTLSAQGFATFQPNVQFNLRLAAKEVRLRYPVGTRAIVDSSLLLTGSLDSALLSGRVVVDRLSLTKEFDLSTFADQFTGNSAASPGPSFMQNIKLNVSLNSASDMALANSKLSIQGSANLMVRGTAAEPVLLGRTDITDGELFFNGLRYKVESGVIQFVNPVQTEPVVNMHVTTTVNQFDISLNCVGPIERMRVTYTSDPPLAPVDIINLLATGQTTEAASTSATTPQSVIAGQLTSQFSSRVEKLAGISSLTIDPGVGGGPGNAGARLTVQQRVTKNLFFSFTTDLQNSSYEIVQVEYQLSKKFAVSTTRDQNGGYTVQIKMHKSF